MSHVNIDLRVICLFIHCVFRKLFKEIWWTAVHGSRTDPRSTRT
jgi:hypothetical protein